jgi:hypothetical protein
MARLERCLETRDGVCPVIPARPEPCEDECVLEGINWCPGMRNRGHPPRVIAEAMAYREAERRAAAAEKDAVPDGAADR